MCRTSCSWQALHLCQCRPALLGCRTGVGACWIMAGCESLLPLVICNQDLTEAACNVPDSPQACLLQARCLTPGRAKLP